MHFNTLLPEHRWVSSRNQSNRWYPVQNCLVSPWGWRMLRTSLFLTSWFRSSLRGHQIRVASDDTQEVTGWLMVLGRGNQTYFLYWRNVHHNHGFIKYIGKLLQVTGFFLKATFGTPASFTSGMQVSLCVCTLTRIFPAVAPLVCEQMGESVRVSASTRWTQNGSADSLIVVLNISSTWKTEEVHAFRKFTPEQTQALTLTHGLCLTEAWSRAVVSFLSDWITFLSVLFPSAAGYPACSLFSWCQQSSVHPLCRCYRSALATRKGRCAGEDQEYGCWERECSVTELTEPCLFLAGEQVNTRDKASLESRESERLWLFFFTLPSSMSPSVYCTCLEDVAENYQVYDPLSKGGHMRGISWVLALAQSSCWLVDSTEKGFLRSPTQPWRGSGR